MANSCLSVMTLLVEHREQRYLSFCNHQWKHLPLDRRNSLCENNIVNILLDPQTNNRGTPMPHFTQWIAESFTEHKIK
uniref:Uncharacterized protein n=1 Tax=Glossina austeni TaxID=7395 RepID=A0A1A9UVD0_GLOAU